MRVFSCAAPIPCTATDPVSGPFSALFGEVPNAWSRNATRRQFAAPLGQASPSTGKIKNYAKDIFYNEFHIKNIRVAFSQHPQFAKNDYISNTCRKIA
jgi:hypothetical protein